MTYTEAVQMALKGDERGFGFLYQNTYKSKLYLSLQYMKNESDAEDVLQDVYVKAFSNLENLKDPEKFSSWLGQIVANTAKNALARKNPTLFTDMETDEEESEPFEEQIPDEDVSNQPELSYTREETRQMVDELIDSLSDEQRVCILMYHMEDMSIREIADTLDCSESTVKSRLNYGRKNLKAEVEKMQKKGYRLYSLAPLALLTLLLHTDAEAAYADPSFAAAGRQISNTVFNRIEPLTQGTASANPTDRDGNGPRPDSRADAGESQQDGADKAQQSDAGEPQSVADEAQAGIGAEAAEETGKGGAVGGGAATETGEIDGAATGSGAAAASETEGAGADAAVEAGTAAGTGGAAGAGTAAEAGAGAAAKAGSGAAAKAGFFSTVAGKVTIGVIVAAVAGGTAVGILSYNRSGHEEETGDEAPAVVQEAPAEEASGTENTGEAAETETEPDRDEADEVITVTTEMYPDLLESGSTKSHFEKLLGYVPVGMTDGQLSKQEISMILDDIGWDCFLRFGNGSESYIGVEGTFREIDDTDDAAFHGYFDFNLEQMNNYLSVLLSEPLTSSDLYKSEWGAAYDDTISGNTLSVVGWGGDYGLSQEASITEAVQSGDTMILNYSVTLFNSVEYTHESRHATLKQQDDGKYRIVSVSSGTVDLSNVDQQTDTVGSVKNLYIKALKEIGTDQYPFTYADKEEVLGYVYFLADMDGDGVQDLVVGKQYDPDGDTGADGPYRYDCRVFAARSQDDGWDLKAYSGDIDLRSASLPSDGKGFLADTDSGSSTGDAGYHRVTIESGTVTEEDGTQKQGTPVEWYDIGDLSGLADLE